MASLRCIVCATIVLAGFVNAVEEETGPMHKEDDEEAGHRHTHTMELFADGGVEHHEEWVSKDGETTTSPKFHVFELSSSGHVHKVDHNHAPIQGPLLEHEYQALLRAETTTQASLSDVAASRLKRGDGQLLRTELTPEQLSELAEISAKKNKDAAVFPKQLIRKVPKKRKDSTTSAPLLRTEVPKDGASMLQADQAVSAKSNQSNMVRTELTQEALDKHERRDDKNVFPKQLIRKAKKRPRGDAAPPSLLREGEKHHVGANTTDGRVMRTELSEEQQAASFIATKETTKKADPYDGHLLRTETKRRTDQEAKIPVDNSHLLRTEMTEEAMKAHKDKMEHHQDRAVFPKALIRRAKKRPRGNETGPLLRDGHQAHALFETHGMVNATHFINGSRKPVVRTELPHAAAPGADAKASAFLETKATTKATEDGRLLRTELTADALAAAEARKQLEAKATANVTKDGRLLRTELTADAPAAAPAADEAKAVFPKQLIRRAKKKPRDGKKDEAKEEKQTQGEVPVKA